MNNYTLHGRQRKLLYILNYKHSIVTGKELSIKLGISERTIRSDISEINNLLKNRGVQVKAIYGQGYRLQVEDRSVLHLSLIHI